MSTLRYRTLRPCHVAELVALQSVVYPLTERNNQYEEEQLLLMARTFPEGTFVVLDDGRPVAMGAGLLVDFDFRNPHHTLREIEGSGRMERHTPQGAYYYGTEIMVHPAWRRRGIGRNLYELRKQTVRRLNRRGIVAGGVLPGYAAYRDRMSAAEYTARVAAGTLYDPTLSFQLENGFRLRGVLPDYCDYPPSDNHAALIFWPNPDYRPIPAPAARRTPLFPAWGRMPGQPVPATPLLVP